MNIRTFVIMAPLALALAACASGGSGGASLAAYPGVERKIAAFYDDRALERDASCPQPRMDSVDAKVVEDTPDKVVMDVRYHWADDTQTGGRRRAFRMPGQGSVTGMCNDWGTRTFTLAKEAGGGLEVRSMTGGQREPGGSG